MNIMVENLFDSIGGIEDFFITEAETADVAHAKSVKRKRIAKYSAAGLAVSLGVAVAYWAFRPKKIAKSA